MIDLEGVINRIKPRVNATTNAQLAEYFGLTPQDFSKKKQRGTLLKLFVEWGIGEKVDLNWLLTGEGAPERTANQEVDLKFYDNPAEYPAKVRDLPPELVIKNFKQKDLARQVTWNLLKLEEIDSREVWEINRYIEYRTFKAIENRRKVAADPDGVPDGQERRCGKDRRKLAF